MCYPIIISNQLKENKMSNFTTEFSSEKLAKGETTFILNPESDRMFPVEIIGSGPTAITVQHFDNKITFTPAYGEWRGKGYILTLDI